jgi:hypothetical protein
MSYQGSGWRTEQLTSIIPDFTAVGKGRRYPNKTEYNRSIRLE